ncbi:MAG: pseudoazurin [Alphaproteobacteria bacterium]|nr:pseudoazurin [Alphaproteobacteria bacterium]MBU1574446.1 pseudoazurin [Alphaproteobacteria bacterium]MBU2077891.1 pseudoazurin [Alphaproteobacteria bacterium]MBU2161605.1 pseudoazurin [Alphaproteobacteria bacterium]MBU2243538.1 pseudoazurin [Alphaproteobacteria bacterium]
MFRTLISGLALATLLGSAANAEVFEVHMLNKSDNGTMVFEPDLVQIAPGDTVKFIPTDKAHNAESVDGMIPAGVEAFKGKINQELDVTFDAEGVYAVKCNPHFAMGMVMTIKVGDAAAPDDFLAGRLPKKAKERFETQLGKL